MHVISREKGDSIIIGDDVVVTVLEIRGDEVRLSIDHPPEVSVHRREETSTRLLDNRIE